MAQLHLNSGTTILLLDLNAFALIIAEIARFVISKNISHHSHVKRVMLDVTNAQALLIMIV